VKKSIRSREIPLLPDFYDNNTCHEEILNYLVRAGRQAPSWYNCQPWKIKISENKIEVLLDSKADKTIYDWHNFNSLLACGAAIENIVIAGKGRGINGINVKFFPDKAEPLLVARITLNLDKTTTDISEIALERSIWLRHTNTLPFDSILLTGDEKRTLFNAIEPFEDISLYLLDSEKDKRHVFQAAANAEQLRFSRQELHEQLHRMIRWNEEQSMAKKTGYTLPSMGVCGFGKLFFRITRPWLAMRFMNVFGASRGQAKRASQGLMHASAIGLLTVKRKEDVDLLKAGQAMENLWLQATRLGLDVQPHTTLTLFHWIWVRGDSEMYSQAEKKILLNSFRQFKQAFSAVRFEEEEFGYFLFRIGRGSKVGGYTLRDSND